MAKITIIGAGGYVFPITLTVDILSFPELQDSSIFLHDINPANLAKNKGLLQGVVDRNRLPAKLKAGTDLARALDGADYVIVAFQVGGIPAYTHDVEIPRRYGIDQPVGDTLGPGGVFRGLRSIAAFMKIARVMKRVCPDALLLQYANPMAINCWALNLLGIKTVGLCHSVQGTSWELARQLGVPHEELTYKCGGINHQAWFTEFKHKGRDVYPRLREIMFKRAPSPVRPDGKPARPKGKMADVYYYESVRTELMRSFGYFHTESSHHGSEYVPWFRKNPRMVKAYLPRRWDYYRICCAYKEAKHQKRLREICSGPLKPSWEYGARIIYACETDKKSVIYGSVPNWGAPGTDMVSSPGHIITNLPRNCAVEVACLVDRNGVQPAAFGALPEQCAAINRLSVNVQELAVMAGLTGDREKAFQAVALDSFTGAHLTLPQIRRMTDEMFKALKRWLPQFKKR